MTGNLYSQSVDDPPFISDTLTERALSPDDAARRTSDHIPTGPLQDGRDDQHAYGLVAQPRMFAAVAADAVDDHLTASSGKTEPVVSRFGPTRVATTSTRPASSRPQVSALVWPAVSTEHSAAPIASSPQILPSFSQRTTQIHPPPPSSTFRAPILSEIPQTVSSATVIGVLASRPPPSPKLLPFTNRDGINSTSTVVARSSVVRSPLESSMVSDESRAGALAGGGSAAAATNVTWPSQTIFNTSPTARWRTTDRETDSGFGSVPARSVSDSNPGQVFRDPSVLHMVIDPTTTSSTVASTLSSASTVLLNSVAPTSVADGGGGARHLPVDPLVDEQRVHHLESSVIDRVMDEGSSDVTTGSPSDVLSSATVTSASGLVMTLSTTASDGSVLEPSMESHVQAEDHHMPAGTVAGIVIASIGFVALLSGVLGLLIFKKYRSLGSKTYDNKLSSDTCSYLDNLQVSYINNHIDIPKESSEEMFSLDNDSFLNSLEAMTMENYWAEDNRSTKV